MQYIQFSSLQDLDEIIFKEHIIGIQLSFQTNISFTFANFLYLFLQLPQYKRFKNSSIICQTNFVLDLVEKSPWSSR